MVLEYDENTRRNLLHAKIYFWEWNLNTGITLESFDDVFLAKINDLLGQAIHSDLKEYELKFINNWYKITILNQDINGKSMSGIIQDITIYKNQIEDFQRQANTDALTGFPNRFGLEQLINQFDFNQEAAIIFIDLDNFKKLNDVYGHHAGDQMLISVAKSIANILPEHAFLSRVSGDEFVVFVENKVELDYKQLASKILTAIIHSNDKTILDDATITASMGIALSPRDANSARELIDKADLAMYVAKKRGKAKFLFYSKEVHEDYEDYLKVHKELVRAFKENEFKKNFQAIYDLNERKIEVFELCPYWVHPIKGLIAYDDFLQVLYEEGLIFPFDEWMIEEAVKTIAELKTQGISIKLSVNISPKHLALEHFHQLVEQILHKYQVEGSSLYFEMVEFILKEDFHSINHNFMRLKELGCKIIIDGFGINHSTILMLKDMHFDIIKIHKYFVETLNKEISSEIIVDTILELANRHNKLFIADGVLDEIQFKRLRELGCEYAQGSYLSDPKPTEAIIEMIKRARKV